MKTSYSWELLPYLRPYRWRFLWALAQVFLIAGFELLKPWPLQIVIDNVLGGKTRQKARLDRPHLRWRAAIQSACRVSGRAKLLSRSTRGVA